MSVWIPFIVYRHYLKIIPFKFWFRTGDQNASQNQFVIFNLHHFKVHLAFVDRFHDNTLSIFQQNVWNNLLPSQYVTTSCRNVSKLLEEQRIWCDFIQSYNSCIILQQSTAPRSLWESLQYPSSLLFRCSAETYFCLAQFLYLNTLFKFEYSGLKYSWISMNVMFTCLKLLKNLKQVIASFILRLMPFSCCPYSNETLCAGQCPK